MKKRFLILSFFLGTTLLASGQPNKDAVIHQALVYGVYNYGIPLHDSSVTVIVKVVTEDYTDSIIVDFNAIGQITKHVSKFQESAYTYSKDKISRSVKGRHPMANFKNCKDYAVSYYLVDGKLKYADVVCDQKTYRQDYDYSIADNVVSVKSRLKDEVLKTDVFLFDGYGNIQWQTVNTFGGFRLNYSCNYKLTEYISNLGLDTSILYATITNETIDGKKRYVIKDRYTISDTRGNKYGEIFINRLPLKTKRL
jgi:hypothetical protein